MASSGVDHSLVDAGLVVELDIAHFIARLNFPMGFEKIDYNEWRHELKQEFVDSVERSTTKRKT